MEAQVALRVKKGSNLTVADLDFFPYLRLSGTVTSVKYITRLSWPDGFPLVGERLTRLMFDCSAAWFSPAQGCPCCQGSTVVTSGGEFRAWTKGISFR